MSRLVKQSGAAGVMVSMASDQDAGRGSIPTAALQEIRIKPIPMTIAKRLVVRHHYLHSLPGGTKLCFGVFMSSQLLGTITLGAGPMFGYKLVQGATPKDCLTLSRLWLSDELPKNSESRVMGILLRLLRRYTNIKFLISYADPALGHVGTIYQASNWIYTGLSSATPQYDLGDGRPRHSRSFAQVFGTHSMRRFAEHNIKVSIVPQGSKHRFVYFIDASRQADLKVMVLPYPKKEKSLESD